MAQGRGGDACGQVNDFYTKDATIQPNGRVIRPMYLLQVKAPAESHGSWDLMKVIATISGDQAFWPPDPACPASH